MLIEIVSYTLVGLFVIPFVMVYGYGCGNNEREYNEIPITAIPIETNIIPSAPPHSPPSSYTCGWDHGGHHHRHHHGEHHHYGRHHGC